MNSLIITKRNYNRGAFAERQKYLKDLKALTNKNSKETIITFPDSHEETFPSAMKACRTLGVTAGVVARWIKVGGPKTGKYKGYSARYKESSL